MDTHLLARGNRGLQLESVYLTVPKLCTSSGWKNEKALTGFSVFSDVNGFGTADDIHRRWGKQGHKTCWKWGDWLWFACGVIIWGGIGSGYLPDSFRRSLFLLLFLVVNQNPTQKDGSTVPHTLTTAIPKCQLWPVPDGYCAVERDTGAKDWVGDSTWFQISFCPEEEIPWAGALSFRLDHPLLNLWEGFQEKLLWQNQAFIFSFSCCFNCRITWETILLALSHFPAL